MTPEERQAQRDRIRDSGIAMMDAIKAVHGEGEMFFRAMAVTTENLRAFDERRPLQKFKD